MKDRINFVLVGSHQRYANIWYDTYQNQLYKYTKQDPNFDTILTESGEGIQYAIQSVVNPMNSSWPMKCYNVHHTSQSPFSTAHNPLVEKWRFYPFDGSWVEDTPVIDCAGSIYFGAGWDLYSVYSNGTFKWKFRTNGLLWGSSPAINDDGTIYVGSWDWGLYAIYPNGTLEWRYQAGATIASSPVISEEGIIYFGVMGPGNDKGRIYAVYPNGTEKWHYDTGYWIVSDPAIAEDGTVYIGSGDSYLYALYPNGTLKWRFKTGDEIHGDPSIPQDGTVYIGSYDGYLYALYPNNGTMKWKCDIGYGTDTNAAIAADGTIYSGGTALYAIYPNGTHKWTFDLGPERWIGLSSSAISADGTIYVGVNIGDAAGGEILAVNPDGTEKWRKRLGTEGVQSSPSIAEDGTVYIGSDYDMGSGYLHAFGRGELRIDANGPYNGYVNEDIQYTGTVFGGIPPYTYYWDFGDGNQSDQQNPTHHYMHTGTYIVTFTVTDNEGNFSSDNTTATIEYHLPTVQITRPEKALYLMDVKIRTYPNPKRIPLIIGPITIEAEATQEQLGIDHVEFYIDNTLKATVNEAPYTWKWTTPAFFRHTITVIAYDTMNNTASAGLTVWKFF